MEHMELVYALPVDPDVPPAPALLVNDLPLDELPVGKTRLYVELVGDGLANGIRVPVMVARGARPGPTFGLTACVHGNELNGIPVIHRLLDDLDVDQLTGTVVGVVAVNVPGVHRHDRNFSDGSDLNRIMPGDEHGGVAEVYAYRVIDRIVRHFDMLIDLHTASFGRINSLYVRADMTNPKTAKMAYLQRPQIIVHNMTNSTLRGTAMSMGIPAITVEIGDPQRWQEGLTRSAVSGIKDVLVWAGHIPAGDDNGDDTPDPVVCRASSWMYTDRGGLLRVYPKLCDRVERDQHVATVTNAFGDPIREYKATRDAIVVGKSTNPVGQTGARIVHLGYVATETSEYLRRDQC